MATNMHFFKQPPYYICRTCGTHITLEANITHYHTNTSLSIVADFGVNMVVVLPPLLNRFGPFLSEAVNCCNCRTIIGWYILQVDPTYDWGHMMPGSYVFDLTMLHYVGPAVVIQDDPHPNQNNGLQANADDDPHPNQNNGQQQNAGPMQNGD